MVVKRVYIQNIIFYSMLLFLALWHYKFPNNASVLALWFLPLLYLVFLSIQLSHTRHDSLTIKIVHHIIFIAKFVLIYLTVGLLEFQPLSLALSVFGAVIIVISIVEYFLLKNKKQLANYKGLIHYTMSQVKSDPSAVKDKTKYQNETNLSIFSLAFMLGGIHALDIPEMEIRSIFFSLAILLFVAFLYRKLQIALTKTHDRLLEHKLLDKSALKKRYILAQIMLHLSMLVTIGVRIIDGPNSVSFLIIIPILMNIPLIQLNRILARSLLTDEERELMNID